MKKILIKKLFSISFFVLSLVLLTGVVAGKVSAVSCNLVPNGYYSTTITFQDNGEVETGTLWFKPNGTLVETNTAVAGNHYGTWTSTGSNSFSLQFTETLPNGFVVKIKQTNDQFTHGTDAFSGTSVGTVYNGDTIVGQRTATITAIHN